MMSRYLPKNEKETTRNYCQDIEMEFEIEKCAILMKKKKKKERATIKGIELAIQERMNKLGEKEFLKFLRISSKQK